MGVGLPKNSETERVGFEPTVGVTLRGFSKATPESAEHYESQRIRESEPPHAAPAQQASGPAVVSYADLAAVVAAWPTLPEPIRRAVLAIVGTTTPAPTGGELQRLDDVLPPAYER